MDKKFIIDHKIEFNHWLNNGKLLRRTYDYEDREYSDWCKSDIMSDNNLWSNSIYKPQIIIDDEYVDLRKALIDGKTIQIYDVIKQHETDPSLDVYGWRDFKSFNPNSSFTFQIDRYKIKEDTLLWRYLNRLKKQTID